jgi:hypothetical protein
MHFKKVIGLALISAIIISLTSCGEGTDSSIEFEKRAYQIDCESSGVFGGGTLWQGLIWFAITKNTGPAFEFVDSENTEVSNADFNWGITNYNFSFDLLDKDGNKVASSSKVEGSSGGVGVTFTPIKGYEAVGYIAYLDGKEIASQANSIWVEYPGDHMKIIDGKCVDYSDKFVLDEYEEFISKLPWCKTAFRVECAD